LARIFVNTNTIRADWARGVWYVGIIVWSVGAAMLKGRQCLASMLESNFCNVVLHDVILRNAAADGRIVCKEYSEDGF